MTQASVSRGPHTGYEAACGDFCGFDYTAQKDRHQKLKAAKEVAAPGALGRANEAPDARLLG